MENPPTHSVTERHKLIANRAAHAFGGTPHVHRYHHDTEALHVDVLRCDDRPDTGVVSYSTIGLSDYDNGLPTRVELCGACTQRNDKFPNVLASAAFMMMRSGKLLHPGVALKDYVKLYYPDSPLPHLYFTAPFLWKELNTFQVENLQVSWLLAIPISQVEHRYLLQYGDAALERLFEKQQIDFYDLHRRSAIAEAPER